jgi:hypothetical protein
VLDLLNKNTPQVSVFLFNLNLMAGDSEPIPTFEADREKGFVPTF